MYVFLMLLFWNLLVGSFLFFFIEPAFIFCPKLIKLLGQLQFGQVFCVMCVHEHTKSQIFFGM